MEKPAPTILVNKKITTSLAYKGYYLTFSSEFDSGNLGSVALSLSGNEIHVESGRDKQLKPSSKCWFYFSIEGEYEELFLDLVFEKVNILSPVAKAYDLYRPVVRQESGEWLRLPTPVQLSVQEGDTKMKLQLKLTNNKKTYIALIYPWSVKENEKYLAKVMERCSKSQQNIYANLETLIYSCEKRKIHLLSLSSSEVKTNRDEDYIEHLYPERQTETHVKYSPKPIILVIARVHPGEVGSSHALNGMIDFLASDHEVASKLRKEFMFWIIPMLNPDGVENGNNRMDSLGQNLNRFYHLPDLAKQPSCYAVKALIENSRKQIYAFFDLHGHGNRKSCFLYGNSIPLTRLQAQSILFAKVLSLNCPEIEFGACNFSKKQMSSKDKNEDLSKEGCARVVVHRWTSSPYCYTLQTGLHKNVKVDEKGIERYGEDFYSIETYQNIGVSMLISFNQMLQKNNKKMDELRKEMLAFATKLDKYSRPARPESTKDKEGVKEKTQSVKKDVLMVPCTVKEFKFPGDETKQNSRKSHSSNVIPDKSKEIEELMLQKNGKAYLHSLDNYPNEDD